MPAMRARLLRPMHHRGRRSVSRLRAAGRDRGTAGLGINSGAVTLLVRNLSQIATPAGRIARRGQAMRELSVMEKAVIVVQNGRFAYVGPENEKPPELLIDEDFDANGATAVPGFVDTH